MKKLLFIYVFFSCSVLLGQKDARMIVQAGHFDEILCMNFSPNGKWLVSGGKDRLVVMYDVKTGLQMVSLSGLKDWITQLEFSYDNKKILGLSSSSVNGWSGIYAWDVTSGDTLYTIPDFTCGHLQSFRQCELVNRVAILSDGSGCLQFQVHDLNTGKKLSGFRIDEDISEHWSITADGKTILYEDEKDGNLVLVNAETGVEKSRYAVKELEDVHTSDADIVFISDDNKFYHRSFGLTTWMKINLATGEITRSTLQVENSGSADQVHLNKSKSQVYVNYGAEMGIYSLPDMKLLEKIEYPGVSYAEHSAAFHEKKLMAVTNQRNVYFVDIKHKRVIREFNSSPCQPLQAVFSNNSKTIAIADYYTPVKIWDLLSADAVKTVNDVSLNAQRYEDLLQFSPDDKVLFTGGDHPELVNIPTLEHKSYAEHFYINFSRSRHHDGGTRIITQDFSKLTRGKTQYEMSTGRQLCEYEWASHAGSLHYTRDGKYVYQYTHSYETDSVVLFVHSTENCSLSFTYKIPDVYKRGSIAISRDSKKIAVAGTGIAVCDFLTGKVLQYYKEEDIVLNKGFTPEFDCSALDFSPDGKMLAVADETTRSIGIIAVETGKILHILKGHTDKIYTVTYSPDGLKIVSVGEDKKIMVWNAVTGKLDVTFVPSGETDYVAFTPDNYYMCSKNGVKAVAYRVGNKMFRAEQFDLRQNRPDTVLQRLGYATKFSLKMYKKAWKKRVHRSGYTEEMLGTDYDIPAVEILKVDEIPSTTTSSSIDFEIKLSDSLYNLSKYNVYVNDVPVYGAQGVNLSSESLKNTAKNIHLDLSNGQNLVQVTTFNAKGVESIRESFEIFYNEENSSKPDLYILAIGVSNYKDKARDLKFAAKDAKDLTGFLKNNSTSFDSVHVKLISGIEAIRTNVLAARSFFKNAGINDQVVLYFSGHGLLDEELNYYLAMYDVDFNKPQSGGLAYNEFENLIDNISCRNRLILVDACHSGEVDKDETVVTSNATALNVTSGTRSGGVAVKPKAGLKNSLALMRELFTETQKGCGATIISAAGGMEYALESADWNNGVFTYAILDALKDNHADYNFDKVIRVSELQLFVSDKVYKLTRGAQLPTARRENIENNFIVK